MKRLFDLATQRHAAITKEAFVLPALRTLGGSIWRNKALTAGTVFVGMDAGSGLRRGFQDTTRRQLARAHLRQIKPFT